MRTVRAASSGDELDVLSAKVAETYLTIFFFFFVFFLFCFFFLPFHNWESTSDQKDNMITSTRAQFQLINAQLWTFAV